MSEVLHGFLEFSSRFGIFTHLRNFCIVRVVRGQDEERTPIKQDVKKGNLRFYPYNINWNYGLLPQTWEDPAHVHPELEVNVRILLTSQWFSLVDFCLISSPHCYLLAFCQDNNKVGYWGFTFLTGGENITK